jgi:hypothetical protein
LCEHQKYFTRQLLFFPYPDNFKQRKLVAPPDDDRLNSHAWDEGACAESDEAGAVGAGPLGEYQHLLPVPRGVAAFHNVFDRVLPRVWVIPATHNRNIPL